MSEFSRDIEDYMSYTFDDIEWEFGERAVQAVKDEFEYRLMELLDRLDYAESKGEREQAIAELESFFIGSGEIESISEEAQLEELTDYMSQSYKDDREKIAKYIELTGSGYFGGGGGGGGASPSLSPTISEEEEDIFDFDFEDLELFDEEEIDDYLEEIDFSFFDLLDPSSELGERIGSFFENFF
jgi:hypothetical protein